MPRINLLPWREQQRKDRKLAFTVGILGALIGAGVVSFIGYLYYGSLIESQQHRNDRMRAEITTLDREIEEINRLDAEKQKFIARMQIIEKLQRSRPEIVHVFDQLVRTIPDGVNLVSLKQTDRKLQMKGLAQSSTRVASYMRNIDASEWLSDPSLDILETKGAGDGGSDFTLNAMQKNPQLASGSEQVAAAPTGPAGARRPGAKQ